jgi:putative hemolysin
MKTNGYKSLMYLILATLLVSGCSLLPAQDPLQDEPIGMPNPASVYCEEQGGTLEMRENENGQYGVCVFPDGSECEEWAYFRGECQPGDMHVTTAEDVGLDVDTSFEPISMQVYALYGNVVSSGVEVPAPSTLLLYPDNIGIFYITGENGEIEEQILEIRDMPEPGNKANFWGSLDCPALDQCLLTVTEMRVDGPGNMPPADQVEAWEGVIYSAPPGPRSGGDDYFALLGSLPFQYGLDSTDDAIRQQIEQLRDSGQAVRISGLLYAARPDWNGTQLMVTSIEPIDADPSLIPPAPAWQ